eukprot:364275-Chlamydomonas_euryale.AAC.6
MGVHGRCISTQTQGRRANACASIVTQIRKPNPNNRTQGYPARSCLHLHLVPNAQRALQRVHVLLLAGQEVATALVTPRCGRHLGCKASPGTRAVVIHRIRMQAVCRVSSDGGIHMGRVVDLRGWHGRVRPENRDPGLLSASH